MSDHEELNKAMSQPVNKLLKELRSESPIACSEEGGKKEQLCNVVQWTSDDNRRFIPAAPTCGNLPPGLYAICSSPQIGTYLEKINVKTENLLRFPQTNCDKILSEIQKFWDREGVFNDFGLVYKRGILTWGPPGSGKSCAIQLIIHDVIQRGGIAINFTHPGIFEAGIRLIRAIQPTTPIVVLMEDIDVLIQRWDESQILNILDGVEAMNKMVFLASTNYPELLGPRIVNRPSRFDKRFRIGHPNEDSRLIYFEHLFRNHKHLLGQYDIKKWVDDTEGLSLAHLKELFTAIIILGDDYDDAIEALQSMREHLDSVHDSDLAMGFASTNRNGQKH